MYFVYMAKNDFGQLYVGVSLNPKKRLHYHNSERGAQFTKGRAKFHLVFLEAYESMVQARQREIRIKKWRREKKEMLIGRYQRGVSTKMS